MINDIAPKGRASLPEKLKVEVFNRLRPRLQAERQKGGASEMQSAFAEPLQDLCRETGHGALSL